ncbi:type VI secretion system contractile sheath small subunit, partial [Escherichia coli]|nr:type VI secretion system contractile sheath small subunit [Escherichia coli]
YMDGKNGAEELIAKILQDPTLLKSLSQMPKNDESAKGSEE